MDLSKYKSLFISESREHLEEMTNNLLVLEANPSDNSVMDEIFRHAHSIKGMAASMEYDPIEVLSHTMEDVMDIFRKGLAPITPEAIDELLAGRDSISVMVDEVERADKPRFKGHKKAIDRIKIWGRKNLPDIGDKPSFKTSASFDDVPETPPETVAEETDFGGFDGEVVSPETPAGDGAMPDWPDYHLNPQTQKGGKWFIKLGFEGETEAPAARAFLAVKRMEALGALTSEPTIEQIRSGKFEGVIKAELETNSDISKIREVLDGLTGVKSYQLEPVGASIEVEEPPVQPAQFESPEPATAELARTVKVETRALDAFVNAVGELLTVKSGLRDISRPFDSPELNITLDRLEALIHDLHSQIMDVRMMPLETITSRFPRTVRDLARTAAKEIDLLITGQDIELDRAILERLNDPFLHLLRNSVDHGIEFPDEREKLRKPRKGKITVEASREKDMIVIVVTDDGKGIDAEVIKETAIARGLVDAENAEHMSVEESLMLICMPGFSTSEQVSFISGRGVGMDVVKSTIESIGGTMRISSTLGKGIVTTLHLPRTVSILSVLLVNVCNQIFAVPIGKLLKTVEIRAKDIKESQRGHMVLLDEDSLPLYDLKELLGIENGEKPANKDNGMLSALVVDHGNRPFVVKVDSFMGQEEAFIRPLGRPLSKIEGLAGIMTRGDGKPVFVLDISNLRSGSAQS